MEGQNNLFTKIKSTWYGEYIVLIEIYKTKKKKEKPKEYNPFFILQDSKICVVVMRKREGQIIPLPSSSTKYLEGASAKLVHHIYAAELFCIKPESKTIFILMNTSRRYSARTNMIFEFYIRSE